MSDGKRAALREGDFILAFDGHEPPDGFLLRRFSESRDPAAFEALVRRHGPMVQGVCRRVLGDAHSAEDAFQATFLVLVRKLESLRKPDQLANWLYGVAVRVARKARLKEAIRVKREKQRSDIMPPQTDSHEVEWRELAAVLDEELSQIPEKYRAPLVLCYLGGKTNAEAAEKLGLPAGSMSTLLARAREILRRRLKRRGVTLSATLLAVLLAQNAAQAAVPATLVSQTAKLAAAYATNSATAGVSAEIVSLVDHSLRPDVWSTIKASPLLKTAAMVAVALFGALGIEFFMPTLQASVTHASEYFGISEPKHTQFYWSSLEEERAEARTSGGCGTMEFHTGFPDASPPAQ
jgi:RNA polymerase sigma factor (sigma-70 family)